LKRRTLPLVIIDAALITESSRWLLLVPWRLLVAYLANATRSAWLLRSSSGDSGKK